jgi:hypothetical protein
VSRTGNAAHNSAAQLPAGGVAGPPECTRYEDEPPTPPAGVAWNPASLGSKGHAGRVPSSDGERVHVSSRRRRGRGVAYLVGLAALCYLSAVGINYLFGRADIWFHGIVGLGPFTGGIAVEWWNRRRRRQEPP